MNYKKIYDSLIERSKNRVIEGYVEKHHIIPKCLGGSDDSDNIAILTPEEHYVAHQLLVKLYPGHRGLVWAAIQMSGHSENFERSKNKIYGWLRRKHAHNAKQRIGNKNGSYGKKWYHKPETLENVKCAPGEEPEGFILGRKLKPNSNCAICGEDTGSRSRKFCSKHFHTSGNRKNISKSKKPKTKRLKKIKLGPSKSVIKKKQTEEYYKALYDEFANGEFDSIKYFIKAKKIDKSVQAVSSGWIKYVEEYEKTQGFNELNKNKQKAKTLEKYSKLYTEFHAGNEKMKDFSQKHGVSRKTLWKRFKEVEEALDKGHTTK